MKSLINRRAYRDATQANLVLFAENVLLRTRGIPEFAFASASIEAIEAPLAQYTHALALAQNRGRAEVSAKNDARETLVLAINHLADLLESQSDIGETRILQAGFDLRINSSRPDFEPPSPQVMKAITTGKKGELRVQLASDSSGKASVMHACEYSEDQGQTWKNGVYRPSRSFVLQGLPSTNQLLLRFRTIGSGGRLSAWSEPVQAVVG
ncbi:MAG: hypothetical protein SFV22_01805 [Saprospiraceae bacterium]|nr:hypothetical protein [Saprospiraceae bacterium]